MRPSKADLRIDPVPIRGRNNKVERPRFDYCVLEQMLATAADWRQQVTPQTVERVLAEPTLAHYVNGWPIPGDIGVVAADDSRTPIGAAWCRFLPEADPGYGFVASDIPEVTIGVIAQARRRGVGRALLHRLIDEARRRHIDRLSLSVSCDNPAITLYASLGFVKVANEGGATTMVFGGL